MTKIKYPAFFTLINRGHPITESLDTKSNAVIGQLKSLVFQYKGHILCLSLSLFLPLSLLPPPFPPLFRSPPPPPLPSLSFISPPQHTYTLPYFFSI